MISESEKGFLQEYAYGKLPLIQLFPVERMSFPLFDFEARRFKEWEKKAKSGAKIEPSRVLFDLKSNRSVVFAYYMDHTSCPFLKGGRCLIYDRKRAFICRMFPFNRGPFLETGEELKKEDMFGSCKEAEGIISSLDMKDKKRMVSQLYSAFGDDLLDVIEYDHISQWTNRMAVDMIRLGKVRPAMNYPYKHLLKRIMGSEKTDLMDFLVEEGIKTREEIENLINRADNNIDAKEILAGFLG